VKRLAPFLESGSAARNQLSAIYFPALANFVLHVLKQIIAKKSQKTRKK
jgi:hypothetical protein